MKNKIILSLFILVFSLFVQGVLAATINVPTDHATIQAAINAANTGDTINVAAGTYSETLNIDKDVDIVSASSANTFIQASAGGVFINVQGTASGFTLDGFTLVPDASTTFVIQLTNAPSDVAIKNNIISTSGVASQGISVGAAGSDSLLIQGNTFTNGDDGDGYIWAAESNNIQVKDNTFSFASQQTSGYAIQIQGASGDSTIYNNNITNAGTCIFTYGGTGGDITNLNISRNTLNNCINAIRFHSAGAGTIAPSQDDVVIEYNTITNAGKGLRIPSGVDINSNNFKIRYNTFSSNTAAVNYEDTDSLTAEKNFWGTSDGSVIQSLITGAGTVDYIPWMNSPFDKTPSAPIVLVIGTNDGYSNNPIVNVTLTSGTYTPDFVALSSDDSAWTSWMAWNSSYLFNITDQAFGGNSIQGNKTIYVKVKDYLDQEQASHATGYIVYDITNPTANAGADKTVNESENVNFNGSLSTDANGIMGYSWDFGDTNTGTGITATNTYTDNGTYTVTLTAADNAVNSGTDTMTVTVLDLAPTADFTINNTNPRENNNAQVLDVIEFADASTTASDSIVSWNWSFGDGNTVATQNPTHSYDLDGDYTVTLTVEDDDGSTGTIQKNITVSFINDRPLSTGTFPAITLSEDTPLDYNLTDPSNVGYFTDEEGQLSYNIIESSPNIDITVNGDIATITPLNNWYGTVKGVYISASDGVNVPVISNNLFNITVAPSNDLPVINITQITVQEDSAPAELNLSLYTTDVESDPITFTYSAVSDITEINCSVSGTTLTYQPEADFFGQTYCNLTANDGTDDSEVFQLIINVENVNDIPNITSAAVTSATEDVPYSYQITASDKDNEIVSGTDTLTYSLTAKPAGMGINPSTGLIVWLPENNDVGNNIVTVRVDDGKGYAEQSYTLTVSNTNDLPTAPTLLNTETIIYDDSVTLRWSQSADDDNDTINYDVYFSNETEPSFKQSTTNTELVVNGLQHGYTYYWYVAAGDSTGNQTTATKSFAVSLKNAPVITSFYPLANPAIAEGDSQLFNITSSDIDANDTLTYSWELNGTEVSAASSYLFSPDYTQSGNYTLTASVTDSYDLTASKTWTVAITNNEEPSITSYSPLSNPAVKPGASQAFTVSAKDDSILSYSWKVNSVQASTSASYAYTASSIGDYNISVDITDGEFSVSHSWNLKVSDIPVASTFGQGTTDFSEIDNLSAATDIVLAKEDGKIDFGDEILDLSEIIDLDNNVIIEDNFIGINTDALPQLNKPASLTMKVNLDSPVIYYSEGFTTDPDNFTKVCDFCTITFYDKDTGELKFTVEHFTTFMPREETLELDITDVEVKVDSKTDKSVLNGRTVSKKALPGSTVKVKITVKNQQELEIEDIFVEGTLFGIDDDEDLDEESNEFDLRPGRDKTITLIFEVPKQVDEDTYDLDIHVEGNDENTTHEVDWTIYLEVEKDKHDLAIEKAGLMPDKLSCVKSAKINFDIVNYGRDQEEEVAYSIYSDIGIDAKSGYFELSDDLFSDDSRLTKSLPIKLGDIAAGTYPVTIKTYYNKDKLSDTETLNLVIEDCEVKVKQEEEKLEVKPEIPVTKTPEKEAEKKELKTETETELIFKESTEYMALLIGGVVILIVLVIASFAIMFKSVRKD